MRRRTLLLTFLVALAPLPARAQDVTLPRFEIGGVVSGLVAIAPGDGVLALAGAGPSVTVGLVRGIRLDVRAHLLGPNDDAGVFGLYDALIRFPVRRSLDGASSLSVSAGVGGLFSYYRAHEYRTTRPDGSIVVYPEYRDLRATVPSMAAIGVAHQRIVSSRASLVLGADALIGQGGIVARATAGVVFAAGRYR